MIDLTRNEEILSKNIACAREHNIIIPTLEQMKNPEKIPEKVKEKLKEIGLFDINPSNLFRITWKNEQKQMGGQFGKPNYIVLPKELTGVDAKILCMVGKWFPTGSHKVGASFGCLIPRLISGQFDVTSQQAVWPSTGNYCRAGAFKSKLFSNYSIVVLPAEMSRERFEWLSTVASEIIATPGSESNVKEIFDKTWEIKTTRENCMVFNQFEDMGNHLWHYTVTGSAIEEAYRQIATKRSRFAGACFTAGSAGTMAAGDYLKQVFPFCKLGMGEALQCPTLLNNGFGSHRIEGIGDKHVPWIHNVKNTDLVIAIDDEDSQRILRLFNDPFGREFLEQEAGVSKELVEVLDCLGISGIANVLCAIKMAKYYELTKDDVVATVLTDSAGMYDSRIEELAEEYGAYDTKTAAIDYYRHIISQKTDNMEELSYYGKKRIHNLKYYTWVEQQGKSVEDLEALWYDTENTFGAVQRQAAEIDALIQEFNERTTLL